MLEKIFNEFKEEFKGFSGCYKYLQLTNSKLTSKVSIYAREDKKTELDKILSEKQKNLTKIKNIESESNKPNFLTNFNRYKEYEDIAKEVVQSRKREVKGKQREKVNPKINE